ncbi:MAG: hypothetical protein FH751_08910 [Firmicutes bacterium]|nr:hypothetical protein [Bacillota bacterium]
MKLIRKNIKVLSILLLILLSMGLLACSNEKSEKAANTGVKENKEVKEIKLSGLEKESISVDKINELDKVSKEFRSITSSGEEKTFKVEGVLLNRLLKKFNKKQSNFTKIRFIATDGYSINLPSDILTKKDVVLASKVDGEKQTPFRVAVNNERSMYWVKDISKIEFLEEMEMSNINKVVFFETLTTLEEIKKQDYTYYESTDKAIKVSDMLNKMGCADFESVFFKASDGFKKSEDGKIFRENYIKITGENAPLFISPDLPKGMHVKNILTSSYGNTVFFSIEEGFKVYDKKEVKENKGIPLTKIINEVGLKSAEKYIITATDGYNVEISSKDLNKGIVYKKDNVYQVVFKELPKNTNVKHILKIEVK